MVRSTEVTAAMQKFVAQINAHDPFGIMALCTMDHVFIDSLGSRVSGRERLQQAWTGYFAHPEDDIFYVIEGTKSVLVGEAWTHATRGSFILVPGGVTHDFENRGETRPAYSTFR